MTYHYPGHPPYPPVQRGPNYPKIVFFVALGLLIVVASITAIVTIRHPKSDGTPAAGNGTAAAAAAVCQPGSLRQHLSGPHVPAFHGATDVAQCTAKISAFPDAPPDIPANERYGVIWIVQFPSPDAARTEAASKKLLAATAVVPRTGTVLFAAPSDWTGTSLQPLARFGFQITPTPMR